MPPTSQEIRSAVAAHSSELDTLAAVLTGSATAGGMQRRMLADLTLAGVVCYPDSLEADPGDASLRYLAVDVDSIPLLLAVSRNGAAPARFTGTVPIRQGRFVIPFGPWDRANVAAFATEVQRAFLPRPQRDLPAIAAGNRHPELSLPAVFDAYSALITERGLNLASTVQLSATREMTTDEAIAVRDGTDPQAPGHTRVSIRHLYHAGLWAAIRAGFRSGYSAEADHVIVSGRDDREIAQSMMRAQEAIGHASGYTKFTTDTSQLFELRADTRHAAAYSDAEIYELFDQFFEPDEQRWILGVAAAPVSIESRRYEFDADEARRLAVKFGRSLKLNEQLYETIRREKAGAAFDFEPSIDEAETLTTVSELIFCARWLHARGCAAQLLPPNLGFKKRQPYPETQAALEAYTQGRMWPELAPRVVACKGSPLGELEQRIGELAAVARHFDATLSVHSGSGKQPAVLNAIRTATRGRVNYKISGELQLQLFDVLAEQPSSSDWHKLYDRMVAACEKFASAKAFGKESELAARFRSKPGPYLGKASAGRIDGNRFLIFWLGNMVGSRDTDGRFFKEELDELPAKLRDDVRARNTRYIKWLASHVV